MDQVASPDIPAYLSYALVFLLGLLVARAQVNGLLLEFPERWGFLSTWAVFWAHAAFPVLLFWLLDYTSTLHDTSLFAAIVVAFGWRQILAGGLREIQMPGQTSRLWKPIEAWVNQLVERITSVAKRNKDRFDDRVRTYLVGELARMQRLLLLTLFYSKRRTALETDLNAIAAEVPPPGVSAQEFAGLQAYRRVQRLLEDLREAAPQNYGYFLYRRAIIPWFRYWQWFGNARARATSWGVALAMLGAAVAGLYFVPQSAALQVRYFQWRIAKTHASERDRSRAQFYFRQQLCNMPGKDLAGEATRLFLRPLVALRARDTTTAYADDVLHLVMSAHSSAVNPVVIPLMIEGLRTENSDVRIRLHRRLKDLQEADYKEVTLPPAINAWNPGKDDSPGQIDSGIQAWGDWWMQAQGKGKPAPLRCP